MARLFGTEIPNEKRIEASLPYIYGIGRSTSKRILEQAGINPDIRTGQLTDEQLTKIVQVITTDGILIEGDLRREKQSILKRLTSINCYRGQRHRRGHGHTGADLCAGYAGGAGGAVHQALLCPPLCQQHQPPDEGHREQIKLYSSGAFVMGENVV